MTHIAEFHASDLAKMAIQPHQAWARELLNNGYADHYEQGLAQTLWDGEEPIACFGEVQRWPGNGECWAILARNLGMRFLAVHQAVVAMIDSVSTPRLQAYVDATFAPGVRWMFALGFKVEGKLTGYLPNGNDAFLFSLLRGEPVAPPANPFSMIEAYDEPDMLAKIMRLESEMLAQPQMDIEPVHRFSHGVYAREITIPKGTLLTGKIHATEHLNIISKGDISVLTDTGIQRIKAPATLISKVGTKRIGYTHEETVWTTIHGTHETDLARLEDELIIPAESLTHHKNGVLR